MLTLTPHNLKIAEWGKDRNERSLWQKKHCKFDLVAHDNYKLKVQNKLSRLFVDFSILAILQRNTLSRRGHFNKWF